MAELSKVKTGDKLSNGALVIAEKSTDQDFLQIILCWFNGQYVTWLYNLETKGASGGYYFEKDIAAAAANFEARR